MLRGYRGGRSDNRSISRESLVRFALANRISKPDLGMIPFRVVTIGLDPRAQDAAARSANRNDIQIEHAQTTVDLGILVAPAATCCAVVSTSIGRQPTIEVAEAIRKRPEFASMLLMVICGADQSPAPFLTAGYNRCFREPVNYRSLTCQISQHIGQYQNSVDPIARHRGNAAESRSA